MRIDHARIAAAIRKDLEAHPNGLACNRRMGRKTKKVRHPVLGTTVVVEMRTSRGVTVHEVPRTSGVFGHIPGAFTQRGCQCSPQLWQSLEAFYDRIDADLDLWRLAGDYKLGCPYAVCRVNASRRHALAVRAILERDAVRRGLV